MTDATAAVPQPTLLNTLDGACAVLLVRHGRSADVVPGSPESSDPPLHELGVEQAKAVGARLARKQIDVVVSSHLRRAHDTALAIATAHGIDVGVHHDLEEVRLGEWGDGEFRRRAAVRDPEWVAWSRTGRWDGIPGGEGDASLRARVRSVIDPLAAANLGRSVVVVCHGGVINAYCAEVLGLERSIFLTVENTSITVVRWTPEGASIVVANDCHHLYDPVLAG